MNVPTDHLSPLAGDILKVNQANAFNRLVTAGTGNAEAFKLLNSARPADLFVKDSKVSPALQEAALSGLWLWHDWLDQSHTLSQNLHDSTGSFWHAIMHRREGDFSNSKYWYARAVGHPALSVLATQAASLVHDLPSDRSLLRIVARGFDPNALVDLIEEIHEQKDDPRHAAAVRLQRLEWQALFDHCTR